MLFLDEVGEMSPVVQAKLLRVLQEREFQRLGGTRTLKADVRVIAATNRDLAAAMAPRHVPRGPLLPARTSSRSALPPLRERPEDIPPLAEAFLEEIGRPVGPARRRASPARPATSSLAYPWPGNVRELRNARRARGDPLRRRADHQRAPPDRRSAAPAPRATAAADIVPPGGIDLEAVEREIS